MSKSETPVASSIGIQYLGGLEPASVKNIQQAVQDFKVKTKFKEGNSITVTECCVTGASRDARRPLAHRYRVTIYLGDEKVNWPVNHGEYLTENGVIAFFRNLAPLWNLLKNYRVKKAIEHKKRIGQLNRAAEASEKEIAKW